MANRIADPIPTGRFYSLRNNHSTNPVLDNEVRSRPNILVLLQQLAAGDADDKERVLGIFRSVSSILDLQNQHGRDACIGLLFYVRQKQDSECFRVLATGLLDRQEQAKKENADFLFDICCAEGIVSSLPDLALDLIEYTEYRNDVLVVNAMLRACRRHRHYLYMAKVFQDFAGVRDLEAHAVVVEALCEAGDAESAVSVMRYMWQEGEGGGYVVPTKGMCETVLDAFYGGGEFGKVNEVLVLVKERLVEWLEVWIRTVKKLCEDKKFGDAKALLARVERSEMDAGKWSEIEAMFAGQN